MVYGIYKGSRVGVVYCAVVVQEYCNRVSKVDGGGSIRMIALCRNALECTNIL